MAPAYALPLLRQPDASASLLGGAAARAPPAQLRAGGGGDAAAGFDEELVFLEGEPNRVVWCAGGAVRREFTADRPIAAAAWCRFHGDAPGAPPSLCLLHPGGLLTAHAPGGDEPHLVPLPADFTALAPLPAGLLLSGAPPGGAAGAAVLPHPLDAPQELPRGWGGERVLWSSDELPYVCSYNQAQERLAVWSVRPAAPPAVGTPLAAGTPGKGPGAVWSGNAKRKTPPLELRLPDGSLSPEVFKPTPRSPAFVRTDGEPGPPLYPTEEGGRVALELAWEQRVPPAARPAGACLTRDEAGAPLLCVLNPAAASLLALRLPPAAGGGRVEPAFTIGGAVAAAAAERGAARQPGLLPPHGLLVVAQPDGGMAVYAGAQRLCSLAVAARDGEATYAALLGVAAAQRQLAAQLSTADEAVTSEAQESPHAGGGGGGGDGHTALGGIRDLGAALEQPFDAAGVGDAAGSRVTVEMRSGARVRVALPGFLFPGRSIAHTALSALHEVLPAPAWWRLYADWAASAGAADGGGDPDEEWHALADLVLAWAGAAAAPGRPRGVVTPATSSEATGGQPGAAAPSPWDLLLQSAEHKALVNSGRFKWLPPAPPAPARPDAAPPPVRMASDAEALPAVLLALHSVYEDCKMDLGRRAHCQLLLPVLGALAGAAGGGDLAPYRQYYVGEERAPTALPVDSVATLPGLLLKLLGGEADEASVPLLVRRGAACVRRSSELVALYELLSDAARAVAAGVQPQARLTANAHRIAEEMARRGWTLAHLDTLAFGAAAPLREALSLCAKSPPQQWSPAARALVGSLPVHECGADEVGAPPYNQPLPLYVAPPPSVWPGPTSDKHVDGMEALFQPTSSMLFSKDLRLHEVRRLLSSNRPAVLKAGTPPEGEDATQHQQARLLVHATRTMALPLGRAALTYATVRPLPTEPLRIPALYLAGSIVEQNDAIVELNLSTAPKAPGGGAMADITAWPEFHNGVAAGLCVAGTGELARTWIVYNKPAEPTYTHAGMLMALGMTGHLQSLGATDLYRYLSQEHDATTIGLLLGMSASKRSSMDPSVSKMLFLHLPTRHPNGYPELELSSIVQAAALVGVGLLYQGTCNRTMAEVMLEEIGRRAGPSALRHEGRRTRDQAASHQISHDREGYALAAGIALGLLSLGRGSSSSDLSDLDVVGRLGTYISGNGPPSDKGAAGPGGWLPPIGEDPTMGEPEIRASVPSSFSSASPARAGGAVAEEMAAAQSTMQLVMDCEGINLDNTCPAGMVALGLMYLMTNDEGAAALIRIPGTLYELDAIKPHHVGIAAWMKSLILWDRMEPTDTWETELMPGLHMVMTELLDGDPRGLMVQEESVWQAGLYAVAGECLALGMRHAGTCDEACKAFILKRLRAYVDMKHLHAADVAEAGVGTIAVALACVMAGSGDLEVFKLLRALRLRISDTGVLTYGSHSAIAMAIGILFLGGGVAALARDKEAIAALAISLFPVWPSSSLDQRNHLQALRHMWALAVRPCARDEGQGRDSGDEAVGELKVMEEGGPLVQAGADLFLACGL